MIGALQTRVVVVLVVVGASGKLSLDEVILKLQDSCVKIGEGGRLWGEQMQRSWGRVEQPWPCSTGREDGVGRHGQRLGREEGP